MVMHRRLYSLATPSNHQLVQTPQWCRFALALGHLYRVLPSLSGRLLACSGAWPPWALPIPPPSLQNMPASCTLLLVHWPAGIWGQARWCSRDRFWLLGATGGAAAAGTGAVAMERLPLLPALCCCER
ncbi:hypothetical protein ABPG75_002697 [Micractinium tetrahymenae]